MKVQKIGKGEGISDWNFKVQAYKTKKNTYKAEATRNPIKSTSFIQKYCG